MDRLAHAGIIEGGFAVVDEDPIRAEVGELVGLHRVGAILALVPRRFGDVPRHVSLIGEHGCAAVGPSRHVQHLQPVHIGKLRIPIIGIALKDPLLRRQMVDKAERARSGGNHFAHIVVVLFQRLLRVDQRIRGREQVEEERPRRVQVELYRPIIHRFDRIHEREVGLHRADDTFGRIEDAVERGDNIGG